jgi:hypothetical protein
MAIRNIRSGLDPETKLVEIRYADQPVTHPFHEMPAYGDGQIVPRLNLGPSSAEYHAPEFVSQTLRFLRIIGAAKALG